LIPAAEVRKLDTCSGKLGRRFVVLLSFVVELPFSLPGIARALKILPRLPGPPAAA
jgi:hypothetical protein